MSKYIININKDYSSGKRTIEAGYWVVESGYVVFYKSLGGGRKLQVYAMKESLVNEIEVAE